MTFGEKLQALRRGAGLSQDALAEQLEVSRQAVSKWERDEAMPETDKVLRIARLFSVSLDELLLDQQPQPEPAPMPRYVPPTFSQQLKDFLNRHGRRLGLALMAVGLVICLFSVGAYFGWQALGREFLGTPSELFGNMVGGIQWNAHSEIMGLPPELWDYVGGSDFGRLDGFPALQDMDSMMSNTVRVQATLFLIGLLPGLVLLVGGGFLTVKYRKPRRV